MKKQSYQELLQLSQKDKESQAIPFLVKSKKLDLESDILATQHALSDKQIARNEMIGTTKLSFKALCILDDEIAGLEAGEKRLLAYMEEFFPGN